ncbi:MAG: alpha/beta hydrolase [Pseudomonadota bacterium]
MIDPKLFRPEAVARETAEFNADLEARLAEVPPTHEVPVELTRQARAEGRGIFPSGGPLEGSEWREIPQGEGPGRARVSMPDNAPRGLYLHIHGGGWALGAPDQCDDQNQRLARETGCAVVSIAYRLAPEHPYPAAAEDCEAAARWALAAPEFKGLPVVIGGESAGAHLSVVTLLRLRSAGLLERFRGAVLNYGCYDLRLTPSARNWGERQLILSTPTLKFFQQVFAPDPEVWEDPLASPLLADLRGLVPALFQVGTADPLLDDTLMMAPRWSAAGNVAEVAIHPGGVHAFDQFDLPIAKAYLARKTAFAKACFAR